MDWLSAERAGALGSGALVTIAITVATTLVAVPIGVAIGTLRTTGSRPTRWFAGTYVELFRNVPALIQIIFWVFAFPNLFPGELRRRIFFNNSAIDLLSSATGLPIPYYLLAACFGLILNTSGHLGELFRSGLGSIPAEQIDSARTLGASKRNVFWSVMLPDGMRSAFPAISSRLIHNLKNTALVSFASVPELFHQSQSAIEETFRAWEFLLLAAALYLGLSTALTAILRYVDKLLHRGKPNSNPHIGTNRATALSGLGSFRSTPLTSTSAQSIGRKTARQKPL